MSTTSFNVQNFSSTNIVYQPDVGSQVSADSGGGYTYSPYPNKASTLTITSGNNTIELNLGLVAKYYACARVIDVAKGKYSDYLHVDVQFGPTNILGLNTCKMLCFSLSDKCFIEWSGKGNGQLKKVNGDQYIVGASSGNSLLWIVLLLVIIAVIIFSIFIGYIIYNKKYASQNVEHL